MSVGFRFPVVDGIALSGGGMSGEFVPYPGPWGSVEGPVRPKPSYKHVPHRDKPAHLVARRNARERRRVQAVNTAFARLRRCVPVENRSKRLSKVKTLHHAIEYINNLQALLKQGHEHVKEEPEEHQRLNGYLESEAVNKENHDQPWSSGCEQNYWTYLPYNPDYIGHFTS